MKMPQLVWPEAEARAAVSYRPFRRLAAKDLVDNPNWMEIRSLALAIRRVKKNTYENTTPCRKKRVDGLLSNEDWQLII